MTLCGVLKDILLVGASVAIWGTPISGLQGFGYSIALCGLIYYKLGGATLKAQFSEGQRWWAEYGIKHPVAKKLKVTAIVFVVVFVGVAAIAPTAGYDTSTIKKVIEEHKKGKDH